MGRNMIRNEYRPLNNKFRLFGYIVSLVGLFKITIPQNQWLLIPILIQNFYTLRALKNGPHKDIFSEFKRDVSPCLLYTSPSPRDYGTSRMPSSA